MLNSGLSQVDITPPVGCSLAGYFEDRISEGVHDPLLCQTLVLELDETRVALVTCDIIAMLPNTVKAAQSLIAHSLPFPAENVFIHSTHTHTGPASIKAFGVDTTEAYLELLPHLMAGGVRAAYLSRKPARIGFGVGREEGVSFCRRYLMKDGTVRTNPGAGDKWEEGLGRGNPNIVRPTGPIDPGVGVMRVDDGQGQIRGMLVNFANHCDTVGGNFISADYPGVVRKVLRNVLGDATLPAFFNGTCGNLNHVNFQSPNVKPGYFAHTEWIGTVLGAEALRTTAKIHCGEIDTLRAASKTLEIALRKPTEGDLRFARNLVELGPNGLSEEDAKELGRRTNLFGNEMAWAKELLYVAEINANTETVSVGAVRIGDGAIVFLPGEIFVEYGLRIKENSPLQPTFVVELTNSGLGYIPTREAFEQGTGYEERLARSSELVPEAGDRMVDAALELLEQMKG